MPSFRSSVEPVLGTRLTMRIDAVGDGLSAAEISSAAADAALAEADRLDALLSRHRPDSAFSRWRRGDSDPPAELIAVLASAEHWHTISDGAFHPALGAVIDHWRAASVSGVEPCAESLRALTAEPLPFLVSCGVVTCRAEVDTVDVHGIAKGWVVDRMLAAARSVAGVDAAMIDLGGDIAHGGVGNVTVAIENPFTVADNAAPLTIVRLDNRAIATSAGGRRGWQVGTTWYGHLIDPRTGWPVPEARSCTALAATAADADAAASAGAVLGAEHAGPFAARSGVALLIVDEDGTVWRSDSWTETVAELHGRSARPDRSSGLPLPGFSE